MSGAPPACASPALAVAAGGAWGVPSFISEQGRLMGHARM